MCGIYGVLGNTSKEIGISMSNKLTHRGPDCEGVMHIEEEDHKVFLGHTRLSIIDLSNKSKQPIVSLDNNYIITFNGEIYNYQELKDELVKEGAVFRTSSDTEVVLVSYIHWGKECVKLFRGMFAFCILNKQNNELFLARDRFGIKPLIYSFANKNHFLFTSEIKSILDSPYLTSKINYEAVVDYFKYGAVSQPKTILEGYLSLMPGHTMCVKPNLQYTIEKYYSLEEAFQKNKVIPSFEEAKRIIREDLEEATKYHLVADVEVGAFLSGGVDSTAVVALMTQFSDKPINTFSLGFDFKTGVVDETDVAERTAKFIGTRHQTIRISDQYILSILDDYIGSIDQPCFDGINTYIISQETAKHMRVAVSGLGGDEVFAGYKHFSILSNLSKQKQSFVNKLKFSKKEYSMLGKSPSVLMDIRRTKHYNVEEMLNYSSKEKNKILTYPNLSTYQQISLSEIEGYLLNTLLRDGDMFSMAHSLEVRPVLLDHPLVERGLSLKDEFKIRGEHRKLIFIKSVEDLIPEEVYKRKKTGFAMPFVEWMNGPLNKRFLNLLESEYAKEFFTSHFRTILISRGSKRCFLFKDWMFFIFLSWIERFSDKLDF